MCPGRTRSAGLVRELIAVSDRARAVGRRDAGRCAAPGLDADAERGFELRRVQLLRDLQRNLQLVEALAGQRHADQAAAVRHHEVDRCRRNLLRGDREVAFVLAILVVHDDDHLAAADGVDRRFDRRNRALSPRPFRHPNRRFLCMRS